MSNETCVTTNELMGRIDQLEKKLVKPEQPDMNKILRAEIAAVRKGNTATGDMRNMFPVKKEK